MKPLLIKELRGYLRAARPFTILTIFLVVLSLPLLLFYAESRSSSFTNDFSEVGQLIFVIVNGIALAQLTLLTPSNTAGAISGERERQTLDLLLVTPLSSASIIIAKLAAPVLYLVLLSLATLPISALAFFIGGVTASDLLLAFIIMLTAAVGYGAVGITASLLARSSKGATLLALGITIFFSVALPLFMFIMEEVFDSGSDFSLFQGVMLLISIIPLALSPFVSFVMLIRRVVEGGSLWTTELPTNHGDVTVPAFWLLSLGLWLLLVVLMLKLGARRLRRESGEAS